MNRPVWKWALIVGLPWTILMLSLPFINGHGMSLGAITVIVFSGIVFGVLFGVIIKYLTTKLYNSVSIVVPEDEKIIKEDAANHFKDGHPGVGGKLVLTNKRLIFKSHHRSSRIYEESLGLEKITAWSPAKTWGLLNNRIKLEAADKEVHIFAVDEPGEWMTGIDQLKNSRLK